MLVSIDIQEPWFSLIRDGKKKVEGRKGSPKWNNLKAGDTVSFVNNNESFLAKIIGINKYSSLEEFLTTETLSRVLPHIRTIEHGKKIYMSPPINWTQEEIDEYGILAIEVQI